MQNYKLINTKYLIIGNSAGGIGAAEAIREIDRSSSLTIVSDEPYPAYSRPLIAKLLTAERNLEQVYFRPADFYSANNIDLISGIKVTRLLPEEHAAILQNGSRILWERLLIATGGRPIVPDINGTDASGVFNFTEAGDAIAIAEYIKNAKRALVIGGGLIGLSVSEALIKKGLKVTMVELKERVLNSIVDATASNIAADALAKAGVSIILNQSATGIKKGASGKIVTLGNGDEITCDIVIIAIGVSPRIELAYDAGIKINRGILVDRNMITSHPHIFACGDVAEAYDFIREANMVIPIWPNAYLGGRTAGYNMAGFAREYPFCTVMNSLSYFGINIVSAGITGNITDDGYEIIAEQSNDIYKKVVLKDGYIQGLILINEIEGSGIIYGLMRDRVNVNSFKQQLLSQDFGLADLPAEIRRRRLGTAPDNTAMITDSKIIKVTT